MSERNKGVIRTLYREVMGKGRLEIADEIFSPEFIDHMPIMESPDRMGLLKCVQAARRAFPDVRPRIIAEISEGEWVAIAVKVDGGTHQDAYMGIPATDRPVSWTETHFWRLEEGKVVEHYGNVSMFEIHKMLGSHDFNGILA